MAEAKPARRLGFVVNPIAGLGGEVALKGTDGSALEQAVSRGAKPRAPVRAGHFLKALGASASSIHWITCAGPMGESALKAVGFEFEVVAKPLGAVTDARDTQRACEAFLRARAEAVVFVGGDGTARDVAHAVKGAVPILGVPSGVKMHSGVFALSPEAAAAIVGDFAEGNESTAEAEIVDADEEAARAGHIQPILVGVARALSKAHFLQASKAEYGGEDEAVSRQGVADAFLERMDDETLYLFGPGTTTGVIMESMGLKHAALGVDIVRKRAIVKADATAAEVMEELRKGAGPAELVVSAIGRQGFVFGRGNLQFTPDVIRAVGPKRITIVATERKAAELRELLADTGDGALDRELAGHWRVLCGYRFHVLLPLRAASASE